MNKFKLRKYQLLRMLPGEFGRQNDRKFQAYGAVYLFEKALQNCAGMTCIDLGANVGNFTCKMAPIAGKVIAFEPDPWTVEELRRNTNAFHNVLIEPAAASIEDGEVRLYRREGFESNPAKSSLSSSIVSEKKNKPVGSFVDVKQVDFIDYLRKLDTDIGILKIDIEGAEVDLLEALFEKPELLKRIRYIFAETHEKKIEGHVPRVKALQAFARATSSPVINLYWH